MMNRIQFITHQTERYSYYDSALLALDCGIRFIQLRMKGATSDELRREALRIMPLCHAVGAIFTINDNVEVANEVHADGVHLGQKDMSPSEARKILGDEKIIGGTANSFEKVSALEAQGVDYIGLGPYRYTETKRDLSAILGIQGYQHIVKRAREQQISVPIFAIGGIRKEDIMALKQSGIFGVAISSMILQGHDPKAETEQLLKAFENIE